MRNRILALAVLGGLALLSSPAAAVKPVNQSLFGVAIEGHDPVAYHTEGRPVEGDSDYEHTWMGATWRFASAANRDRFRGDPEKFAPAYGGYCAWAVSQGYTAPIDPAAWRIVDGRLYLNYSPDVQKNWAKDIPGHIAKADANWPGIRDGK